MRVAVVGHVEWVEFVRVARVPAPGEISHGLQSWQEPGGAGAVAAVQFAKLAGGASFFTAVGDDDLGRRAVAELTDRGVRVRALTRSAPQRRAFTFLDGAGERTITTIGDKLAPRGDDPLPWSELDGADGVYFVSGDAGALRASRKARVVVATSRAMPVLLEAGVPLDAVAGSGRDPAERYEPGRLFPAPDLVVTTEGGRGGTYATSSGDSGEYPAAPLPGPVADSYGCGDSFAAGLTFALARGDDGPDALVFAARCGAACLTGRGAYEGQLTLSPPAAPSDLADASGS